MSTPLTFLGRSSVMLVLVWMMALSGVPAFHAGCVCGLLIRWCVGKEVKP